MGGRSPRVLGVLCVVALLFGCGGSSQKADPGRAKALLADAKRTLDASSTVHFKLTSAHVPGGGTTVVGGDGRAARPDKFKGNLKVSFAGITGTVGVISVGGKVYAKLPFTLSYAVTDPAKFGFADPGRFMDPGTGVSTLLVKATQARLGSRVRVDGEVVREVRATIPGSVVADLLVSADPAHPVSAVFGVVEGDKQLRRAVLTGPFFKKGVDSVFTIVLDGYGDAVDISAPSTG